MIPLFLAALLLSPPAWAQDSVALPKGAIGMILGRPVVDPTGAAVGQLTDFVVGPNGEPLAGVIDVGGFMGIGMRRVGVAWSLLKFRVEYGEAVAVIALPADEVLAGPDFKAAEGAVVLAPKPAR